MGSSCLVVDTVVVSWGLTISLMGLLLCDPIQRAWHPEALGQCLNRLHVYYGLQIVNIATDMIIVGLPFRPVLSLYITSKERGILSGIFGFCSLSVLPGSVFAEFDAITRVVAVDIARLVALVRLEGNGTDFTWNQVPASIWTFLEPTIALATTYLVHLRPVGQWMRHYWLLHDELRSDRPNSDAYNGSCVAIQTPIVTSYVEGSDAAALIRTPSTSRKTLSPVKTRSRRNVSSTGRRFINGKVPSFDSVDYKTHITTNLLDRRTVSTEFLLASRSISPGRIYLTRYPTRRNNPSRFGSSTLPDVLDLLIVHQLDDTMMATPPSTPNTTSGDSCRRT